MGERFKFTREIIEKAQRIKDEGPHGALFKYARRIGCNPDSLTNPLTRAGKRTWDRERREEENAFIEERILLGDRPFQIRAAFKAKFGREIKPSNLGERMKGMGYDKEVIAELGLSAIFNRRQQIKKMHATKMTLREIAKELNVSIQIVKHDCKVMRLTRRLGKRR